MTKYIDEMIDESNITSAQYWDDENGKHDHVIAVIDGKEHSVPLNVGNRRYREILRQVKNGKLTIKDADNTWK